MCIKLCQRWWLIIPNRLMIMFCWTALVNDFIYSEPQLLLYCVREWDSVRTLPALVFCHYVNNPQFPWMAVKVAWSPHPIFLSYREVSQVTCQFPLPSFRSDVESFQNHLPRIGVRKSQSCLYEKESRTVLGTSGKALVTWYACQGCPLSLLQQL